MKQKLLLTFLMIFTIKSFAQDSKFSIELNYPIPIDENLIGRSYNGIINAGLKYNFANLDFMNLGVSLNSGIFKNTKEDRVQPFDATIYIFSPRINSEFKIKSLEKLHPSVGLGYSIVNFRADVDRFNSETNSDVSSSQSENGVNLNFGLAYDITNNLFLQIQYDFIKIGVDNDVPDFKYNTNINLVKIGLGYRL
ncbi:outer membrane protein [Maribacter aestuarii]|uniref:outer membrane protein n=1 Tax=Maribacter aestuarii TaxID=1130723 RepID=UPI00248B9ED9|nr:outer membrane beta-barrel protein [Maribacter aestuarii]